MAAAQNPGKCGIIAQIQAQLFAEPMFRKTAVNPHRKGEFIA